MIQGFQEQTEPLSEYEERTLLPQIVRGLLLKVGKANAITNSAIVKGMKANRGTCAQDHQPYQVP